MVNKGFIRGASLLLVVGLAIGAVVAMVHISNSKSGTVSLSRQMKLVAPPPALSPVAQDGGAQFKDNLKAALLATLDESKKALNITELLSLDTTTGEDIKRCLELCKPMVKEGIESGEATLSDVSNGDMHNMSDGSLFDLKIRISGVISYTETCLDNMGPIISPAVYFSQRGPPSAHDLKAYDTLATQLHQVSGLVNKALGIVNDNMKVPQI